MKTRKLLCILMILSMLLCCACQGQNSGSGNNNNQNTEQGGKKPDNGNNQNNTNEEDPKNDFDRKKAIEQDDNAENIIIQGPGEEEYTLIRTDTRNPNAEDYLELAYEALLDIKSSANVTDLYEVPLGLASDIASIDPVLVVTTDEEFNKDRLFIVPYINYSGGISYLGAFRESSVNAKDYQSAAIKVYEQKKADIERGLGFNKDDITVEFDAAFINGFNVSDPTETFKQLYTNCTEKYYNVMFASWYSPEDAEDDHIEQNNNYYFRVCEDGINSMEDLNKYLRSSFDEDMTELIMQSLFEDTYLEYDGKLYCTPLGIGGDFEIQDILPKKLAINADKDKAFLILECTRAIYDDNWENILETKYEEYAYSFVKENDTWLCSGYVDIPFGIVTPRIH